jgi:hypothetical protein
MYGTYTAIDMPEAVTTRMPSRTGAGEVVEKEFIRVVFQNGLPRDVGINGCRVEDLLKLTMERIEEYQEGPLACRENEQALQGLRYSLRALEARIKAREEQGVLNTMARHDTVRTEDWQEDFSATGA